VDDAGNRVDAVTLPYMWHPPQRIVRSCLLWRLLDLENETYGDIDLVVATKFPTYAVRHPNKVAWVFHQHRSLYELKDTIYDDFAGIEGAEEYREAIRRMDNRFLRECGELFSISRTVSERLKRYCGMDSRPVYHPPPFDGAYRSGSYGDYVLLVGRLAPLKRVDLAIRAMKHVTARKARLRIVGTGFLEGALRELAESEGVEEKVAFTGHVQAQELISLYENAGCVLYVPYEEDYGYSTIEAFRSKRPVVGTDDSGGPLEFVSDGENGRVVRATPESVASALDEILGDRKAARRYGENGYERVKEISWRAVVDEVVLPYL